MGNFIKFVIYVGLIVILTIFAVKFSYTLAKGNVPKGNNVNQNKVTNVVKKENKVENTIVENKIENTVVKENKVEETVVKDKDTGSKVYEQKGDLGSTDKKKEAINMVRQKWGEDNTVTFRCDHVTSDGEYVIAVVSKDSANVKNYFRVNLENNTVVVDY